MAWFGWKPGRAGARPALSRAGSAWRTEAVPQGYDAQVRAGYLSNAVAQRAVRLVAEGVGGAPLDAGDPALAALIGARGLMEAVAVQLLLHGKRWR